MYVTTGTLTILFDRCTHSQ